MIGLRSSIGGRRLPLSDLRPLFRLSPFLPAPPFCRPRLALASVLDCWMDRGEELGSRKGILASRARGIFLLSKSREASGGGVGGGVVGSLDSLSLSLSC